MEVRFNAALKGKIMKVALFGATGTIGKAIAEELADHEVIRIGNSGGDLTADLEAPETLEAAFKATGPVDAVISAAGKFVFGGIDEIADGSIREVVENKLLGNIALFRIARPYLKDGGSFAFTTGAVSRFPAAGASIVAAVNAGLESFAASVALETGDSLRVNAVSPRFVAETMEAMGMDSSTGISAADTAKAYRAALEGKMSGATLDVADFI